MLPDETFQLHPLGWESDPAEERFKLSTIDPTPNCAYNHYVLFLRLDDEDREKVAELLKAGLEHTLRYALLRLIRQPRWVHTSCPKSPASGIHVIGQVVEGY